MPNNSLNQNRTTTFKNTQPGRPNPGGGRSRKKLFIAGAVILLLAAAAVIYAKSKDGTNGQNLSFKEQYADICKERDVALTASPLPLDQLGYIDPLGKVADGHVTPTDHQYIWPKNTRAADNTHSVVMPADGTVVGISAMPAEYIGDRSEQKTASEDHRIVISHSCRYYSIFIHIHQLSPALAKAAGDLQPNQSKNVNVELKAGDLIGKIGGSGVDWTYLDTNKTLSGFITPSLYDRENWKIHTIDPIALYTGDLQGTMAAASLRSVEPIGGKIDYDVKGALVGNWFREGTKGYEGASPERYWDGHLSIAPDYIDGVSTIVSIGNWDGKAGQYVVKGAFDPATITTASGPVKLEIAKSRHMLPDGQSWTGNEPPVKGITVDQNGPLVGTVLVQVQDGEKLKVETFVGKSAAEVSGFSGKEQVYVR